MAHENSISEAQFAVLPCWLLTAAWAMVLEGPAMGQNFSPPVVLSHSQNLAYVSIDTASVELSPVLVCHSSFVNSSHGHPS